MHAYYWDVPQPEDASDDVDVFADVADDTEFLTFVTESDFVSAFDFVSYQYIDVAEDFVEVVSVDEVCYVQIHEPSLVFGESGTSFEEVFNVGMGLERFFSWRGQRYSLY